MKKLAVILLVLAGCAGSGTAPDGRTYLNGFSVIPPEGETWKRVEKTPSKIIFGKKNGAEYPFVAAAQLIDFPVDVEDEKEYAKTVSSFRELYMPSEQYQIISHEENLVPSKGEYCVKYVIRLVASESEREQYGFTCRHPENKNAVVDFFIAKKGNAESTDEMLQTAAKFLSDVEFEMFDEKN